MNEPLEETADDMLRRETDQERHKQQEAGKARGQQTRSAPTSRRAGAQPGQSEGDSGGERANKWAVFGIVATGVFMSTLDSSIVNISLPTIARYFGVPLSGAVEWIVISYLVVIASVLLSIGRLADMIGRKPILAAGLAIFTIGSALCGVAPSLGFLIAARGFQGLGGALLFAISPVMITSAFPPEERGRALGLNAVTVALGVSAGPTIGGILTESFSWRSIFYVNLPIGIVGFILTLRILTERMHRGRGRFDPIGAVLLAVGLASLTLGLSFGTEIGWSSPLLIGVLAVAVVALGAFVIAETRISDPIVEFGLLRNRVFASANVSLVLSFLALFAVSFLLPFYLEELRHFSTLQSGLLLTPLPLAIAVVAPLSGSLADRFGTRWLAAGGLSLACIGLVLISQLDAHDSVFDIIWRLAITGIGQGLFQSPNNSALLGSVPGRQRGVASGFLATGRVMGQSISVALAGAIFAGLGGAQAGQMLAGMQRHPLPAQQVAALQETFVTGFRAAFLVCAAIAAIGVATSLVRGNEA